MNKEQLTCSHCGEVLTEETMREFDGEIMCEHCLDERTTICECCNERIWRDNAERRSYDVMEKAASTEGGGGGTKNQFMDMAMGLAMGNKMGAVVGTQMGDVAAVMDVTPEATKNCPKCGKQVSDNQKFCPECGAELHKTNTIRCIHCGVEIGIKSKFCPECGKPQQTNCPKCNAEIQGTPKFCPECGNQLKGGENDEK